MKNKDRVFVIRFDTVTEKCLDELSKTTNRSRADAARLAIQIVARLFSTQKSMDLEKQSDKEVSISI